MVLDILNNMRLVLEVLTLRVMIERGVDTILLGYIGLYLSHPQNDLLTIQVYQVFNPRSLAEGLCRALP